MNDQVKFYQNLYNSESINSKIGDKFLESVVGQNNVNLLNNEITVDELAKALKMMKNNRSPGIDYCKK